MSNKRLMKNQFTLPRNETQRADFKSLPATAKVLYYTLAELRNRLNKDRFFHTMEDLCEETDLHINTLKKAKKLLKDRGFIVTTRSYLENGVRGADEYEMPGYQYTYENTSY